MGEEGTDGRAGRRAPWGRPAWPDCRSRTWPGGPPPDFLPAAVGTHRQPPAPLYCSSTVVSLARSEHQPRRSYPWEGGEEDGTTPPPSCRAAAVAHRAGRASRLRSTTPPPALRRRSQPTGLGPEAYVGRWWLQQQRAPTPATVRHDGGRSQPRAAGGGGGRGVDHGGCPGRAAGAHGAEAQFGGGGGGWATCRRRFS